MGILTVVLQVLLVISSLFLLLMVLLHKPKGGGISDMFGGGLSSVVGSSPFAERNLNRITIITAIVWGVTIVLLGVLTKLS